METLIESPHEKFLSSFLAENPELSENLKPGTLQQFATDVSRRFDLRDGLLINPQTALAVENVGATLRKIALPYLKSRGQGKLVPQFQDRRSDKEKESQEISTAQMFDEFIKRSPVQYIHDEPLRILKNVVAKNMLFESDGKGGFLFGTLMNGVVVERHTPSELLAFIRQWADPEKTELAEKRLERKFRDEALALEGMSLADFHDKRKRVSIDSTIEKLRKEYFTIPTQKKLPPAQVGDLMADLRKRGAWEMGYPIDEKDWTLQQKITLEGFADKLIEEHKGKIWDPAVRILAERTPAFYSSVIERFPGLTY